MFKIKKKLQGNKKINFKIKNKLNIKKSDKGHILKLRSIRNLAISALISEETFQFLSVEAKQICSMFKVIRAIFYNTKILTYISDNLSFYLLSIYT